MVIISTILHSYNWSGHLNNCKEKEGGRAWLQQILYEREFTSLRGVIIQETHKREDQGFFTTIFLRNLLTEFENSFVCLPAILLFSFRFWLISVFTLINQSSKFRSSETKNKSRKKLERSKESQVKQMFQISVVRWIEKKKGSNKKQRDTVALWETTMWHTVSNISFRTSWTKNKPKEEKLRERW